MPTASPSSTVTSVRRKFQGPLIGWLAAAGGLGVLLVVGLVAWAYAAQASTIVRNVTIGGQDVGSLNTLNALSEVERAWDHFADSAFVFKLEDQQYTVPLTNASPGAEEVILDVGSFDAEASVNAAFDFGHRGPWWQQAWERTSGWLGRRHEFGRFALDTKSVQDVLVSELADQDKAPVSAGLEFEGETMTVTGSQPGHGIDYPGAIRSAKNRLTSFNPTPITLVVKTIQPAVVSSPDLETIAKQQAPSVLAHAPVTLVYEEKTWTIDEEKLKTLLGFVRTGQIVKVGFDPEKTKAFFDTLRPEIDVEPRDAKFSVTNGRVEEFQTSVVGKSIDADTTLAGLQVEIERKQPTVELIVVETKPLTDTVTTNDLGIKELVAEARTNFKGSPPNRVYNLSFGAKKLHGLLIKPGETFSLVQALGPIDAKNGWKPELVIKGTKITPEYGGGLCQVATTLFRTALNTGLPIVERKNHSLRISYYEPPIGLDATIYEPRPDLKFTNDYSFALLLQTRVEGTELIFSLYGTKDGRVVTLPEPRVFNKTGIPPTQNIEVSDLKPGEKECQAPGHPGADAVATYTVTKADGTSVTQEFTSHYRPIPVICRVGKKA